MGPPGPLNDKVLKLQNDGTPGTPSLKLGNMNMMGPLGPLMNMVGPLGPLMNMVGPPGPLNDKVLKLKYGGTPGTPSQKVLI